MAAGRYNIAQRRQDALHREYAAALKEYDAARTPAARAAAKSRASDVKAQFDEATEDVRVERERMEVERAVAAAQPEQPAQTLVRERTTAAGVALDYPMPSERRPTGRSYQGWFTGRGVDLADTHGFENFDAYVAAVASGRFESRLRPLAQHHGDDLPHGGFAVPPAFASRILDPVAESSIVLPRATIWPMTSKTLQVPMFAGGGEDGPYGVPAQYLPETGLTDATGREFTLELLTLEARSLALYCEAANALVQDGVGFAAQLERAMRESVAWHLDADCLVRGTGVGQPLAVLRSDARVTVAKESGQPAATIVYENVTKMLSRLAPGSFDRAIWVASQTAVPQLLSLSHVVGAGGSLAPAVLERDGRMTLLTRPLIISEKLPAVGTEGDLMLVDLSGYCVGLRAEMALDTSAHVGFQRAKTAFRLILRLDARPALRQPITPANGSTVSPFVTLATRA